MCASSESGGSTRGDRCADIGENVGGGYRVRCLVNSWCHGMRWVCFDDNDRLTSTGDAGDIVGAFSNILVVGLRVKRETEAAHMARLAVQKMQLFVHVSLFLR